MYATHLGLNLTRFKHQISFWITTRMSETLRMVKICDVSIVCNTPSMVINTNVIKNNSLTWLSLSPQLSKAIEDKDLQIASLLDKLVVHNITESSHRHEPSPIVQRQANSNGNLLIDHNLHRNMSILHIKNPQLLYLFNNFKIHSEHHSSVVCRIFTKQPNVLQDIFKMR